MLSSNAKCNYIAVILQFSMQRDMSAKCWYIQLANPFSLNNVAMVHVRNLRFSFIHNSLNFSHHKHTRQQPKKNSLVMR